MRAPNPPTRQNLLVENPVARCMGVHSLGAKGTQLQGRVLERWVDCALPSRPGVPRVSDFLYTSGEMRRAARTSTAPRYTNAKKKTATAC
jgi:hypothetical protein